MGEVPAADVTTRNIGDDWNCIRDNGSGIKPGGTDKIFLLLQSQQRKVLYSGSSIKWCYRLQHQGELKVETEVGDCMEFQSYCPKKVVEIKELKKWK